MLTVFVTLADGTIDEMDEVTGWRMSEGWLVVDHTFTSGSDVTTYTEWFRLTGSGAIQAFCLQDGPGVPDVDTQTVPVAEVPPEPRWWRWWG